MTENKRSRYLGSCYKDIRYVYRTRKHTQQVLKFHLHAIGHKQRSRELFCAILVSANDLSHDTSCMMLNMLKFITRISAANQMRYNPALPSDIATLAVPSSQIGTIPPFVSGQHFFRHLA